MTPEPTQDHVETAKNILKLWGNLDSVEQGAALLAARDAEKDALIAELKNTTAIYLAQLSSVTADANQNFRRAEQAEAALTIAKEFGAGCTHHNLGAIIRQLRAELAALRHPAGAVGA